MEAKSILAVHDLSCHGTASLGIVIPVLKAMHHNVIPLPSAILSSTTDLDHDPVTLATTDWWYEVFARWKGKVGFDAFFTGWLGDPKQIEILIDFCQQPQNLNSTIFIDPVLGDCGVLYPSQSEMLKKMKELVALADVITPNPTEAALLIGKKPKDFGIGKDGTVTLRQAHILVKSLSSLFPKALAIIKSVASSNMIGVSVFFTPENTKGLKKGHLRTLMARRTTCGSVGGTGDLFASLLIGRWLRRINGESSVGDKAAVVRSVIDTISELMGAAKEGEALQYQKLLRCN